MPRIEYDTFDIIEAMQDKFVRDNPHISRCDFTTRVMGDRYGDISVIIEWEDNVVRDEINAD